MISDGGKESTFGRLGARLRGLLSLGWLRDEPPRWGVPSDNGEPLLEPGALAELALLREVVDRLPQHIFAKDVHGRFIMANRAKAAQHGLAPRELLGLRNADLAPDTLPDEIDFERIESKVIRTGVAEVVERYEVAGRGGVPVVRALQKLPLQDGAGRAAGVVSISDDITMIDAAERRARESEERFRQVAETTPYAMFVAREQDGRILYANRATSTVFGFADDPTEHATPELYWDASERAELLEVLERDSAYFNYERRHRRANGDSFWGLVSSSRIQFSGEPAILTSLVDITELREARETARTTEHLLQTVFDHLPAMVFVKDGAGRYLQVNRQFQEVFCTTEDEALGRTWAELSAQIGVEADTTRGTDEPVLTEGRPLELTVGRIRFGDGRERIHHLIKAPIKDDSGSVTGLVGIAFDVKDQVGQAEALRASESMLRRAQDIGGIGTWRRRIESGEVEWSAETCRIWGFDPDSPPQRYEDARARVHPGDLAQWDADRERIIVEGGRFDQTVRIIRGDGSQRHVRTVGELIFADDGTPLEMLGVSQDVTEAVEARMALERQEWVLSRAQAIGEIGTWWRDVDTDTLHWRPETYRIWGIEPGAPVSAQSIRERVHPDDRAAFADARDIALNAEGRFDVHHRVVWPDGTVRHVHTVGELQPDLAAGTHTMLGITHDETERVEAEADLRRSEQRYRALIEQSLQGINVRVDGEVVFANPALARVLGYDDVDSYLASVREKRYPHFMERDRAEIARQYARLQRGEIDSIEGEIDIHRLDGTVRRLLRRGSRTEWDGRPAVLMTSIDITDQHLAREALRESEQRYRALFDSSLQGMYVRVDGEIVIANRALAQTLGFDSVEEFLQSGRASGFRHFAESDREELAQLHDKLRHGELEFSEGERDVLCKDGSVRRQLHRAVGFEWNGQPATLITSIDITDRVRAEAQLRSSERRFRAIAEHLPFSLTIIDQETGRLLFGNDGFRTEFGIRDGFENHHVSEFYVSAKDREAVLEAYRAEGHYGPRELHFRKADGRDFWALASGVAIDYGGRPAYLSTWIDLSERKETEARLRESQALLRQVIDVVPYLIHVKDAEGRFALVNRAFAEFHALEPEQAVGKRVTDLPGMPAEIADVLRRADEEALEAGELREWSGLTIVGAEGVPRLFEVSKAPLWAEAERAGGVVTVSQDITARIQAEKTLREREARFRNLFEGSIQGIVIHKDRKPLYVNEAYSRLLGYDSPDEVLAIGSLDRIVTDRERERIRKLAEDRAAGLPAPEMYETESYRKDGSIVNLLVASRLVDWDGQMVIQSTLVDITERRRAEDELRNNRRLLETVIDAIPMMIFAKDADSNYILVNRATSEFFGVSPAEFLQLDTSALPVPDATRAKALADDRWVFEHREPLVQQETTHENPNGEAVPFHSTKLPLLDDDGNLAGLVGINRDITEQLRAEAELRESRDLLRTIIDTIPHGVFVRDREGRYLLLNRAHAGRWGLEPDQMLGTRGPGDGLADSSESEPDAESDRRVLESGTLVHTESERTLADRKLHTLYSIKAPLRDAEGNIAGVVGISEDITERKLAETERARYLDLLNSVINSAPIVLWALDQHGVVTLSEGKGLEHQSLRPRETLDRSVFEVYADYPEFLDLVRRALAGEAVVGTHETRGAVYERWIHPASDAAGNPAGIIGVSLEVTQRHRTQQELERYRTHLEELVLERTRELREAQAELVTKERLAALGLLTGVVSHELRNPLGTIRTSIFTVREESKRAGLGLDRTLERIDRSITRCDRIIEELLTYTRPTLGEPEAVAIDALVAEVLDDAGIVPAGITLHRDLRAEASLEIDRDRLRRCLINVVQNAAQAITEQADRSEGNIWVSTACGDGRIEVRVQDDGPGIPPEHSERLFEPLFSTKGFGVGLGLPIVKQIMEAHHGGIEIDNAGQDGATVVLWLPLG